MYFLILLLSVVGFYISLYFILVHYHIIPSSKFPLPKICRLPNDACLLITQTKYARILGLPNFLYGLFYYSFLIFLAIFEDKGYIKVVFVVIAWFVVALGVYLSYVLVKVLKINCVLCFISHILNLAIAILLSLK